MKKYNLLLWIILYSNITDATVVADFITSISSGCSPLNVTFTDQSSGNPTTWSWNFGNGNTSTLQSPSAVYNNPGVYTVTLTASDGASSDTKTKTITVFTNPIANFTNPIGTACAGSAVTFNDSSTVGSGAINSWHWDFGDGNAQNTTVGTTTHIYSSSGNFPASLIVTDANGCTANIVRTITVVGAPVASFTASPVSSCAPPLLVTFNNTSNSSGLVSYSWNFGDGTTSTSATPTHNYTITGVYTVKMVMTQGVCKDSVTKNNLIAIKSIVANFVADTTQICVGTSVNFTDTSIPLSTSSTWNFGDGTTSTIANPSHTYSTAGLYTVTLNASSTGGCSNTKIIANYIRVGSNPNVGFTTDTTSSCSTPFNVTFTDTTSGATSWNWDFGDNTTSTSKTVLHSYATSGTYTVSLTVNNSNGCSNTVVKNNWIKIIAPVANFTAIPTKGCAPFMASFSAASSSSSTPITSYTWDFGNGSTATTTNDTISTIYAIQGTYTVKLIIITASGCTDTLVKPAYIKTGTKPIAKFFSQPDSVCFGLPITFTDSTSNATEWLWNFGDGTKDSTQNPMHVYGDTGTYTITLIAYNNGCADTLIKPNLITIKPPKPAFSYLLSCTNYYTVNFTNESVEADSIVWDFGDGIIDSSNNNNPIHIYAVRGIKAVSLTAFNYSNGCSFQLIKSLTIAEPIAKFNADTTVGCVPLTITFTDSSQDASSYLWNFGNGTTSTAASPPCIYNTIGLYSVSLTVKDTNGCTNTKTIANYIDALGIRIVNFNATPLKGCAPLQVTFTDSSFADSTLVKWTWNFGDGTPIINTGTTSAHLYTLRGSYSVTLTVKDTNGCQASLTRNNYIVPTKPYPALAVDTFRCKNDVILFDASATSVTNPSIYSWTFGDGTSSNGVSSTITHFYNGDGIYPITLKVTDVNGCDSSITKNIYIIKPTASFRDSVLTYGCGTEQVKFIDQSTGYVNSWHWEFGNGAISTLQNPTYTYTSPGVYHIRLIVQNIGGCIDTMYQDSLVVVPGPRGSFSFSPTNGCVPLTTHFIVNSTNANYYTLDFGDGTVISHSPASSIQHTYLHSVNTTPIVLLEGTLPNGLACELQATNLTGSILANKTIDVTINPSGPILLTEDSYQSLTTSITGTTSNNISYTWTPSDGLSCSTCQKLTVSGTGKDLFYYLKIVDIGGGGCSDEDSIQVKFIACETKPNIPNMFSPNNDGINDIFFVNGLCIKNDYHLSIFDRWGLEIFSTTERHIGWDGRTTAGALIPTGVYYYLINVDDKQYKGFIQLVR